MKGKEINRKTGNHWTNKGTILFFATVIENDTEEVLHCRRYHYHHFKLYN
jgi:hypothetical protein